MRAFLSFSLLAVSASAQINSGVMSPPANTRPPRLENVGIEQHLNAQVPPDLIFRDDTGKTVKLGDYFGRKPLILHLVYYNCTMLCGEALAGLASAMRLVKFDVGNEFDIVTVSFDPRETPEMAAAKKIDYVKRYGRANAAAGWHFLTGDESSIKALTGALGYQYKFDPATGQFAHASAIMILTPQGKLSRYFYGVEYAPRDVRLGLVEASQNKIGTPVDQVLLFCYHYDPGSGKYGAIAMNMVRLGGATFVLICGAFLFVAWRHDWQKDRRLLRQAK